jgi:hypothetical protein
MDVHTKTKSELRKFGLTIGVAFAIFGGLLFWRDKPFWIYLEFVAAAFILAALLVPGLLRPVERIWMKVAHILGIVMTHIILTLAYFLVITPIGLIMRLFGRDPMRRKFDRSASSYWIPVDHDGPTSRPDKPY